MRDLIIKHMDFSKYELFRYVTADFSVNWPYNDADMFVCDSVRGHVALNPVFVAHIREGMNWTFGPAVSQAFPFLASLPTVKSVGS